MKKRFSENTSVLIASLTLGVVARLALFFYKDFRGELDIVLWRSWGERLSLEPYNTFYTNDYAHPSDYQEFLAHLNGNADLLPTNMLLLKPIAILYTWIFPGASFDRHFDFFLLVALIILEITLIIVLKALWRHLKLPQPQDIWLAFLAPPLLLCDALALTWDVLPLLTFFGGVLLLTRKASFSFFSCGVLWSLGFLCKPYVAILAIGMLGYMFFQKQGLLKSLILILGGCVGIYGQMLIFNLGLFHDTAQGSLLGKSKYVYGTWQELSHGGASLWALAPEPFANLAEPIWGISPTVISYTLLVILSGIVLTTYPRVKKRLENPLLASLWLAALLYMGWFLTSLRMIDRYLIPTVVLLMFFVNISRLYRYCFYTLNVTVAFNIFHGTATVMATLAFINFCVFVALVTYWWIIPKNTREDSRVASVD